MAMAFRGFPGVNLPSLSPTDTTLPIAPSTAKPSFFAEGGIGRGIAGSIGDALLTASGGRPVYAPMQAQRQQRQYEIEDEERKARIAAQYRQPPAPHYFETNDGSQGVIDPVTGQPRIVYQDPTPKVTWTQVDLPNGQKQLVPSINGQIMGGGSAPASPTLPQGFTVRSKGGAAPAAGSPFPLRPSTR